MAQFTSLTLDFEQDLLGNILQAGQIIDGEFSSLVSISTDNSVDNPALIFDSSNPPRSDRDLGTPNIDFGGPGRGEGGSAGTPGENSRSLGNVLIIAKDTIDADGDGLVDVPNDNTRGGVFFFDFAAPVTVRSFDVIDINERESITFEAFDIDGNLISSVAAEVLGENSFQTVDIEADNVAQLQVRSRGTFALDNLVLGMPEARLGDFVFEDLNANGIQDPGEQGISGVTVKLLDADGEAILNNDGNPVVSTTDASGFYEFTGLIPGEYKVMFVQPAGFDGISPANEGDDEANDSDADPANGLMTDIVILEPGDNDSTIDAGFFKTAGLGDLVFEDLDGDGVRDVDEQGIADVEVKLLADTDNNGILDNAIATTSTDATGFYEFNGLTPGNYKVMFTQPTGFDRVSPFRAGDNSAVDSDADPENSLMSDVVNLESGEFDSTIDAGFFKAAPGIDIEKFVNGIDVTDLDRLPEIAPGADLAFTYEVTNTGNVGFAMDEVNVTDDNGTSDNASDDFTPSLDLSSDVGSDGVLSPGETWFFSSDSGTAEDLSTTVSSEDFKFIFTGHSPLDGSNGNVRSFTQGSVSVDVRAFSSRFGHVQTAYLGAYSGGLGVTNRYERTYAHRADNYGSLDYLFFEFDRDVIVDEAFLDYVGRDSDLTVWIGDRNGADISTLSHELLDSFVREHNFTRSSRARWADVNRSALAGDTLVVSGFTGGSNDAFKLKKLDITVPGEVIPGEYRNVATVTAADSASDTDTSGYTNPVPPEHFLFEAENLHLHGYAVERVGNHAASSGKAIKLFAREGRATVNFNGPSGEYDILIGYYDESDGRSQAKVNVGDRVVDEWIFDEHLGNRFASADNLVERRVEDVYIEAGEQLGISGAIDNHEFARFDYIKVIANDLPAFASQPQGLV